MAYTKYSLTPANNTAAPPDGAPEGMLPSAVNDTMRDMMAQIRDCGDGVRDGTYTMTAVKITGGTITGVTLTGNTFSSPVISGGTINNATIGATTATTGKFSTLTNSALTSGRVTYAGASGLLQDDADFTFDGTNLGLSGTGSRFINLGSTSTNGQTAALQISAPNSDASANVYRIGTGLTADNEFTVYDVTSSQTVDKYIRGASGFRALNTNGTERMRIDSSGLVGIGTTSMVRKLNIAAPTAAGIQFQSTGTGARNFSVFATDSNASVQSSFAIFDDTAGSYRFTIDSSGIVTMPAYAAGAATFSASGVISSVSDETWKTKDGVPTNTDAMLQKLEPGYWFYNEEKAPIFGEERQLGFYAQNVHEAIGEEAAPTPEEGKPWGYYDRSVLAVVVMSLKNALNTIEELKQRIATLENK